MHGKNSSALSMLEKIPRNVTADSDIVTTDSEKIEKSVTINRNERSRCVGIRSWGVWWFRLEKMVWKAYRRDPTSFRVYTRISRFSCAP